MCKPAAGRACRRFLATAALGALGCVFLFPGLDSSGRSQLPVGGAGSYQISVSVGLVVLPVTVTNRSGDFVANLHASNFRVYESGRPQQISLFELEDVPVTVGLVIDNSGSMAGKQPSVIAASLAFVRSSNPLDQMFVVKVAQTATLALPRPVSFTSDPRQLKEALSGRPASGKTALYDGVAVALEHLKGGTGERKALIIVSDGGDNASRIRLHDLLKMAESSNAVIYPVGIFDENYSDLNPGVLERLARVTGGQAFFPKTASAVSSACLEIAREIREQYTLGYVPANLAQGAQYRPLRVTVTAPGEGKLRVRTRTGFRVPPETPSPAPEQESGRP